MIKFLGVRDGRPMLGLGLSRGNCERLLQGKPIFIDLKVMIGLRDAPDMNDATVLIFGGENENEMQAELSRYIGQLPKPQHHHDEN